MYTSSKSLLRSKLQSIKMIGNHKKACSHSFGISICIVWNSKVCTFQPIGPARVKQGAPEGKLDVDAIKIGGIKEKLRIAKTQAKS